MNNKIIIFVVLISIATITTGVFVFSRVAGSKNPRNKHVWLLPNGEEIDYHEAKQSGGGFVADFSMYITWNSVKRGTNNVCFGGGGYKNLELWLSKDQTIAWITGYYPGDNRLQYAVLFDIVNHKIFDQYCMWSSSDMNPDEQEIKHKVEQLSMTAHKIEERL